MNIDYQSESRRIFEFVDPAKRAEEYATLAILLGEERDEWKLRCEALRPKPPACAIDEPGGDEDEWLAWDEAMARYAAIAEGRDNG